MGFSSKLLGDLSHTELNELVAELLKKIPNEKTVKSLMDKGGFPYTADPLERLALVLKGMDKVKRAGKNNRMSESEL